MPCSHLVHPGNTSNIHTTTRIGCPTATVSPPPNIKSLVPEGTGHAQTSFIATIIEALSIRGTKRSTVDLAGWD